MRTQRVNGCRAQAKRNVLSAGFTSRFFAQIPRVRASSGRATPLRCSFELQQHVPCELSSAAPVTARVGPVPLVAPRHTRAVAGVERALRARRATPNGISAARSDAVPRQELVWRSRRPGGACAVRVTKTSGRSRRDSAMRCLTTRALMTRVETMTCRTSRRVRPRRPSRRLLGLLRSLPRRR